MKKLLFFILAIGCDGAPIVKADPVEGIYYGRLKTDNDYSFIHNSVLDSTIMIDSAYHLAAGFPNSYDEGFGCGSAIEYRSMVEFNLRFKSDWGIEYIAVFVVDSSSIEYVLKVSFSYPKKPDTIIVVEDPLDFGDPGSLRILPALSAF